MDMLAEELKRKIRGEVDTSDTTLEKFSKDASLFKVMPKVVVRPNDATDIEALVSFATEKKKKGEEVSLTARAAGTDMSGGPLGNSIILDMTAHFNHFISLEGNRAVVEPGMYFRDFDLETKKKNLEMPGYPASRNLATVGGMVANNAGGEKNLKYGKTGRYVEELDVVLADGKTHTIKKLGGKELVSKLTEQSFEGDLYRALADLVVKNKETIEKARPRVTKNSSGYALWDVGDGETSLDLTKLIIGSQGALGVITRITFSLVTPKPYASMTVLFLKDLDELGTIIQTVLQENPDSFESYDDHTFELAVKYFPEFAVQMKAGIISLGFQFLPEMWMLATGGIPKLVLLVEFCSDSQKEAFDKARALKKRLDASHIRAFTRVAKNEQAAEKYWTVRRESFSLLRKKIRNKKTAPFIDDFVVLPKDLPEFLPKLTAILSKYDLTYTIAGHVGDGNFHIIPLIDPTQPGIRNVISKLAHEVYTLILAYHGSISGEHNDGLIRTPYIKDMFGDDMVSLFEAVERIFDPDGIFNPGKKVGTSFEESFRLLDLPA